MHLKDRGEMPMGLYAGKNAILVAAQLGLGNTATRLLLHMALECWDDSVNPAGQEPCRYFGGRESSAIALGFLAPYNGEEPAHRAVKRAVRELVVKGAIRRVRTGGYGLTSEYELLLDSMKPVSTNWQRVVAVLPRADNLGATGWSPQRATF
jgi:hypothetical protein